METQTIEVLKNHGLEINEEVDSENLASQLGEMDVCDLWPIVEDFTGDETIGIDGNEQIQGLTLSYALVDAFENNLDHIGQAEIDGALKKATETVNKMTEEETVTDESAESATPKINKKDIVSGLVQENPTALADEIVAMAVEADSTINESTAKQYYYNVRKELNMAPVGKRGRKPSDTLDRIKSMLEGNLDTPKAEMVESIVDKLGLTEGTAATYYSKVKKQLKS